MVALPDNRSVAFAIFFSARLSFFWTVANCFPSTSLRIRVCFIERSSRRRLRLTSNSSSRVRFLASIFAVSLVHYLLSLVILYKWVSLTSDRVVEIMAREFFNCSVWDVSWRRMACSFSGSSWLVLDSSSCWYACNWNRACSVFACKVSIALLYKRLSLYIAQEVHTQARLPYLGMQIRLQWLLLFVDSLQPEGERILLILC